MKLKTLLLTLLLTTSFIGAIYADFNDGWIADQKGDYKTAFNEWKPLSKQGDAHAQYNIGVMYDNGRGVLKDYKEKK
jgi:TPR repeat protein